MQSVFATLLIDLVVAAVFGGVGGFALSLLQDKGLELPHMIRESERSFVDLGFIGDVLVGALAAVLMSALNPSSDALQLLATTIPAGIGGSGVLKGYVGNTKARMQANRAEMYRAAAWDASRGMDVTPRLDELEEADEQMKQRWGSW